jgi:predicted TIM-barrel fold metal-dependent hydrolase
MRIDCHNHLGVDLLFYLHGDFPYAQHLVDMVQNGRALGITHWIAFPFVSYAAFDMAKLQRGEVELASDGIESIPYAFENRRLLTELQRLFPGEGRRVLPFAMVDPKRRTQPQAEELIKLRAEFSFYGIKIQSTILQSEITSLHREGRIFLELAEAWNIPLLIHSSVAKDDVWAQAHDILDVAEAFPRVRFCLAHSCRFDRECLDRVAALPNTWFDNSAHVIHCQGAANNQPFVAPPGRRFETDYRDPTRVIIDLATAYPDKFLWGSDSPFYSYAASLQGKVLKLMSSYAQEVEALMGSGQAIVDLIAHRNTLNYLQVADPSILD